MRPETLQRLRAESNAYGAQESIDGMALLISFTQYPAARDALARLLVVAFMRGVDAAATAIKAEERIS